MAHAVETMAYTGQTPWHGLGFEVADCLTPYEILIAANLNWKVEKHHLVAHINSNTVMTAKNHYMMLRNNGDLKIETVDGRILPQYMDLGICGPDYTPFQNEEVLEFFDGFVKAGDMKMETAGSLKDGRMVWALAKIERDFELAGGDKVGGYLLLSNPHEWGKAATAMLTQIRVVCNNTLVWALGEQGASFRMPHMNEFKSYAAAAHEALSLANVQMDEFEEQARFLSNKRMHTADMHEYLVRLFSPKVFTDLTNDANKVTLVGKMSSMDILKKVVADVELSRNGTLAEEAIMMSPGSDMDSARGTYWGGVNGVSYLVDHVIGRTRDTALEQAWFGGRAALKRRAVSVAMEMADAS